MTSPKVILNIANSSKGLDVETLKHARERKGVKQAAVANHLRVVRQTYAKWEDHPEKMPMGMAERACSFLGVDINKIFFGTK